MSVCATVLRLPERAGARCVGGGINFPCFPPTSHPTPRLPPPHTPRLPEEGSVAPARPLHVYTCRDASHAMSRAGLSARCSSHRAGQVVLLTPHPTPGIPSTPVPICSAPTRVLPMKTPLRHALSGYAPSAAWAAGSPSMGPLPGVVRSTEAWGTTLGHKLRFDCEFLKHLCPACVSRPALLLPTVLSSLMVICVGWGLRMAWGAGVEVATHGSPCSSAEAFCSQQIAYCAMGTYCCTPVHSGC